MCLVPLGWDGMGWMRQGAWFLGAQEEDADGPRPSCAGKSVDASEAYALRSSLSDVRQRRCDELDEGFFGESYEDGSPSEEFEEEDGERSETSSSASELGGDGYSASDSECGDGAGASDPIFAALAEGMKRRADTSEGSSLCTEDGVYRGGPRFGETAGWVSCGAIWRAVSARSPRFP